MSTHASQVRAREAGREGLGAAARWGMRQALRALADPGLPWTRDWIYRPDAAAGS